MSKPISEAPVAQLPPEMVAEFDREVVKYPPERRLSAVIACLSIVQRDHGWVSPDHEKAVAEYLDVEPMYVHEATIFYDMFSPQPTGRYKISLCTNLPCQLTGGARVMKHLLDKLGIRDGGTSADGMFTVEHCECLGSCGDAPVLLVNDRDMCGHMSEERLDDLLDQLRALQEESKS